MGTGHVMRCLAFAQGWRSVGGVAHFALASVPRTLGGWLAGDACSITTVPAEPGSVDDAVLTATIARARGAGWVVVDGYQFDESYQTALMQSGSKVLMIDDYAHAERYMADIVLNQNAYATESMYARRAARTRLLLGPDYALLRREFRALAGRCGKATSRRARRLLVTFGGSDPHDTSNVIIEALRDLRDPGLHVRVIAGPANDHYRTLAAAAEGAPFDMEILREVRDMPALMEWADMAISAAGSTCWELAFMGVPMALVSIAENQRPIARSLAAAGVAVNLGWYADLEGADLTGVVARLIDAPDARERMSAKGRAMVDGLGAQRAAVALREVGEAAA
jgi:UDP-2,4-diacetamido-2,4,6-trideoxy-beta-L-altropyranose hydrolase